MIQQHLDGAGVSVDIVFSLEVIERCLTRTALMTEIMESPADARRSRAIRRLLSRLVLSAYEDRSLRHLFGWNMQLLGAEDRRAVQRNRRALHRAESPRVPAHLVGSRRGRRVDRWHRSGEDPDPLLALAAVTRGAPLRTQLRRELRFPAAPRPDPRHQTTGDDGRAAGLNHPGE